MALLKLLAWPGFRFTLLPIGTLRQAIRLALTITLMGQRRLSGVTGPACMALIMWSSALLTLAKLITVGRPMRGRVASGIPGRSCASIKTAGLLAAPVLTSVTLVRMTLGSGLARRRARRRSQRQSQARNIRLTAS